jgi:hypothetical protein
MDNEYLSSDFSYKKYSLEHLENWVHDALNCEDLTPQEIYDTIVNCVDENVEYHKKYLTKNIEVLSLLKGQRPVNLEVTEEDWADFWNEQTEISQHYTEEELNAMCDAAEEKEKCREYNLREAEYYNKRAELDAHEKQAQAVAEQMKGGHSQYYYDTGRNKSHDQMIAEGWQMTDDGFWIKETDKGIASVSN